MFTTFRYDKTGTGWGRGDAVWACDAKHGNCTDFHSPFIGMLRADDIPARFDIGFPLPENKDKGDISGYHCWAEFYASKIGWIPVDISEAWKAKEKENYFFGSVDANRVKFSTGRDITLSPKQDGPPLNYFVYPYVEVDGKPYEAVGKQFSFEELKAGEQKASGSQTPTDRRACNRSSVGRTATGGNRWSYSSSRAFMLVRAMRVLWPKRWRCSGSFPRGSWLPEHSRFSLDPGPATVLHSLALDR